MITSQLHKIEDEYIRADLLSWLKANELADSFFFISEDYPLTVKWKTKHRFASITFLKDPPGIKLFTEYVCFDTLKFWGYESTKIPFVQEFADFIKEMNDD